MAGVEDKKKIFDALTVNSARTMGLKGYGLEKGCNADLVILQASDPMEALRLKPNRLAVIKGGKVIARTALRLGTLLLEGRPTQIDFGQHAAQAASEG
jgi:cytosine deaminase